MNNINRPEDQVLIIFGASGDLTKRMLMPSLYELFIRDMLPEKFAIIGTARSSFNDDEYKNELKEEVKKNVKKPEDEQLDEFFKLVYYVSFDPSREGDELENKVNEVRNEKGIGGNTIFYLSTPPTQYRNIIQYIESSGFDSGGWKRVVVEKPFGTDLKTAKELNNLILRVFKEEEIFRIDHFLGKETVQNILVLRFANEIFQAIWNNNYIDYVEIYALESIGVEGRGKYYETTGALRDMVQNHLLQILAFVAMESPMNMGAEMIHDEMINVLHSIRKWDEKSLKHNVVRAQYTQGFSEGKTLKSYTEEESIAKDSKVETYAALKLNIDNDRWQDVPFYIYTGKSLKKKKTEVVIHFKSVPYNLFNGNDMGNKKNKLHIKMAPEEGIMLKFMLKNPGVGFEIKQVGMDFKYESLCNNYMPAAHERLLLDVMVGETLLFTREDALMASWELIDTIENYWKKHNDDNLIPYEAGGEGPDLSGIWDVEPPNFVEDENICWI